MFIPLSDLPYIFRCQCLKQYLCFCTLQSLIFPPFLVIAFADRFCGGKIVIIPFHYKIYNTALFPIDLFRIGVSIIFSPQNIRFFIIIIHHLPHTRHGCRCNTKNQFPFSVLIHIDHREFVIRNRIKTVKTTVCSVRIWLVYAILPPLPISRSMSHKARWRI